MRMILSAMLGLTLGTIATAGVWAEPAEKDSDAVAAQFQKLDADKDGKVSKAEFIAGNETEQSEEQAVAKFMRGDKDKDGHLTLAEYRTIAEKTPEKQPE